jgi:radical SAM protein with 4Fe4S-binding SPASM domain
MEELKYLHEAPKKFLFDGCKLLYHQDKLQDFLDNKRISPIHMDIGIHKACNIRCIYCYGIKQKPSREFITEDNLLLLAEDAADAGIRSIAVVGDGEPTLNKGLYSFVQEAKMNKLDVAVATNGLLLNEGLIRILTSSLVWLRFNISAASRESYAKVHGTKASNYDKFVSVIKDTVNNRNKCTIGLQMVLIPECFDQVIPLAEAAVRWGVDYLVIKQYSDGGTGMPMHFDMDSYTRVTRDLEVAESMSNERTTIVVKWHAMCDSKAITKDKTWDFDRCIDLPFIFQISGNGGCYPCGYMFGNKRYCYGNVNRTRLKDILDSRRYWNIVKKVANTDLRRLCTGQCRHAESLRFMDRLVKRYNGSLSNALIDMCGSAEQYERLLANPPEHVNFI